MAAKARSCVFIDVASLVGGPDAERQLQRADRKMHGQRFDQLAQPVLGLDEFPENPERLLRVTPVNQQKEMPLGKHITPGNITHTSK